MSEFDGADAFLYGIGKPKPWDKELEDKVISLCTKDTMIGDIVRELHIPFDTASAIIHEYNKENGTSYCKKRTGKTRTKYSRESIYRDQIISLRKQGLSYRQIEQEIGLHRKSIGRVIKRYNKEHPEDQLFIPPQKNIKDFEDIKDQVIECYKSGWGIVKLCDFFHIGTFTLKKIISRDRQVNDVVFDWRTIRKTERKKIISRAIRDRRKGMSVRDVCRKYDIGSETWRRRVAEYNKDHKNRNKRVVVSDFIGQAGGYCSFLGQIKTLLQEGKKETEIASELGISRAKVHSLISLLRRYTLEKEKVKKYDTIDSDEIACLWHCGFSEERIAELLKTSVGCVNTVLAELVKAEESS